jgi:hypothetical protein
MVYDTRSGATSINNSNAFRAGLTFAARRALFVSTLAINIGGSSSASSYSTDQAAIGGTIYGCLNVFLELVQFQYAFAETLGNAISPVTRTAESTNVASIALTFSFDSGF